VLKTATMAFRVWFPFTKGAQSRSEADAAEQESGVVALIEDVIASKNGVFVRSESQMYASGLRRPSDAVVASRQIQLGIEGFKARLGNSAVSVSIAIDSGTAKKLHKGDQASPEDAEKGGNGPAPATFELPEPSHDLHTLLALSSPAQILITHEFSQQIADFKGLPLKSFPDRVGVNEYLWTNEKNLEALQSRSELTVTPVTSSHLGERGEAENLAYDGLLEEPQVMVERTPPPVPNERATAFREKIRPYLESPKQRWIAAVAGGSILVLLVVGLIMAFSSSPKPTNASREAAPLSTPATNSPAATPGQTPSVPAAGPAAVETVNPPSAPAQTEPTENRSQAKNAGEQHQAKPLKPVAAPSAPTRACGVSGEYSKYISLAEEARREGRWDDAIRLSSQVLDCDPGNSEAQQVRERAIEGKRLSQ